MPRRIPTPLYGLVLRLVAGVLLATLYAATKRAAQTGVALPEIMFWRQAVTLPMLGGYLAATGGFSRLRTRRITSHAARAAMGTIGMMLNFGAAILLPLALSTTLNFAAPLFAVMIAALVLRHHVGIWRWTAVVSGFAGVLVITQPGHLALPLLGTAAGLGSALANAIIGFQVRDLAQSEAPVSVVFWFALFGTALLACFLPFYATHHSAEQWALLLAVGVVGTTAQLFMTAALRFGAVTSVIVMDYSQIIWAMLYGRLIWGQMPGPTLWAGAPLIVAAGLVIAWREHRLSREKTPAGAEARADEEAAAEGISAGA